MNERDRADWRPVVGYEGLYEVSSLGLVRSINRVGKFGRRLKGQIIKTCVGKAGYQHFWAYSDGCRKNVSVHRSVAKAFIPNPEDMPCVNHINADRMDNRVENLEWCTYVENTHHAMATGRCDYMSLNHTMARIIRRCVGVGMTQHEVGRIFGVSRQMVGKIARLECWNHTCDYSDYGENQ